MGAQAQERESLEATSGPGTWGSGWLSGLLIGAGSKQGQTALMPSRGGYSCRVRV